MAPEHVVCDTAAVAGACGAPARCSSATSSAQAAGDYITGSNHVLPTSGGASARGGLSAADFVRVSTVQRLTAAGIRSDGAARHRAGGGRRAPRARCVHPPAGSGTMRLAPEREHGGLLPGSPAGVAGAGPAACELLSAIRRSPGGGRGPLQRAGRSRGADERPRRGHSRGRRRGLSRSRRRHPRGDQRRAGLRHVRRSAPPRWAAVLAGVPLAADYALDVDAVRAAVTPATRIVFLANPHNPSGVASPLADLRGSPRRSTRSWLFVDEAYADFSGQTLIDGAAFKRMPNLVVGRTFSKAYGLAGLRVGAVIAAPPTLAPIARVIPPYSVNAWAAAALPAAVGDVDYRNWYVQQASASRMLLAHACRKLGLQTWPSAANFMLVRVGEGAPRIVTALAAKGVIVRDRSSVAGCEQCIRITAGLVDDTTRLIAMLEEVLCAAR